MNTYLKQPLNRLQQHRKGFVPNPRRLQERSLLNVALLHIVWTTLTG